MEEWLIVDGYNVLGLPPRRLNPAPWRRPGTG